MNIGMDIKKKALEYYKMGYPVITCYLEGKLVDGSVKKTFKGLPGGHETFTYNDCKNYINVNCYPKVKNNAIVLLCGDRKAPKNVVVYDFDVLKKSDDSESLIDGMKGLDEIEQKYGLMDTAIENTPSGGMHYIFNYNPKDDIKNVGKFVFDGKKYKVDVLCDKKLCVISPSVYVVDGVEKKYKWRELNYGFEDIKDVPKWLVDISEKNTGEKNISPKNHNQKGSPKNVEMVVKREYEGGFGDLSFLNDRDIEKAKELVKKLSDERSYNYDDWYKVAQCLYNISPNELFETFDEFSKRWSRYNFDDVKKKWSELKNDGRSNSLSIGSLYHWVKEDNNNKKSGFFDVIDKHFTKADDDIANVFFSIYKDKIKCAQEAPMQIWYEYEGGHWKKLEGNSSVRKRISDLKNIYREYLKELNDKIVKIEEEKEKDNLENRCKIIQEIIYALKEDKKITSVLKQSMLYFKDDNFLKNLDDNENILCFGLNTYDLIKKEWRKSKPEDYCSNIMGYTMEEVMEDINNVKDIEELISKIYPDKDKREYFVKILASCMYGYNQNEQFHILMGCGANGKSLIMSYLEKLFGSYFETVSVGLVTQKRGGASNCNTELAKVKGKRMVVMNEPEQDAKLNNSMMKELTGGDSLTARALYSMPITFKCMAKFFLLVNMSFKIENPEDRSVPRRVVIINHDQQFLSQEEYDNQKGRGNIHLRDETLKHQEKKNLYGLQLLRLIIKSWQDNYKVDEKKFDIKMPKICMEEKKEFIDTCDVIVSFMNDNYERVCDDEMSNKNFWIEVSNIYDKFIDTFNKIDKKANSVKYTRKKFIEKLMEANYVIDIDKKTKCKVVKCVKQRDTEEEDSKSNYGDEINVD